MVLLAHLASLAAIAGTWLIALRYRTASHPSAEWTLAWIGGRAILRAPRDHVVLGCAIVASVLMIGSIMVGSAVNPWLRLALAGGVVFGTWAHLDRASRDVKTSPPTTYHA